MVRGGGGVRGGSGSGSGRGLLLLPRRPRRPGRLICCRYRPTEPGLYTVDVRWRGRPAPGSPFEVPVCDTTEELGRVLRARARARRRAEHLDRVGGHLWRGRRQVRVGEGGSLACCLCCCCCHCCCCCCSYLLLLLLLLLVLHMQLPTNPQHILELYMLGHFIRTYSVRVPERFPKHLVTRHVPTAVLPMFQTA